VHTQCKRRAGARPDPACCMPDARAARPMPDDLDALAADPQHRMRGLPTGHGHINATAIGPDAGARRTARRRAAAAPA
jgi:hypothetical protein